MRAHTETWDDMIRLQQTGLYPAAFAAITYPGDREATIQRCALLLKRVQTYLEQVAHGTTQSGGTNQFI
jgi:hypothetical protein